jgi:endogenous inhibitor of DNA gyrase (YacG/DUF329 family)
MKDCCPEWYKNIDLNKWIKGKKTYYIEWADCASNIHLDMQYATDELNAVAWSSQMHPIIQNKIISVKEG